MDHIPIRRPQFFFTTTPAPCPYLPGMLERKLVTELTGADAEVLHDTLSRAGFRRSHFIAYTPACVGCSACIPVRVRTQDFCFKRSFRRTTRLNEDLKIRKVPAHATAEQFRLFSRYQDQRHDGSDMALMGFYEYRSMVENSKIKTFMVEFRTSNDRLVAVSLTDHLGDGLSAVYSFFDPDLHHRSLGTHLILWLVEEARRLSLPYVYLGYWISESQKMSYKVRFQPMEAFGPTGWYLLQGAE